MDIERVIKNIALLVLESLQCFVGVVLEGQNGENGEQTAPIWVSFFPFSIL